VTAANRVLQARYDAITSQFLAAGLDLNLFFGNPSYFRTESDGNRIELAGRHITTAHFPIPDYAGGADLSSALASEVRRIEALVGAGATRWIAPQSWHSTVFSPVHSSDPQKIAAAEARLDHVRLRRELRHTEPYSLTFTRVLVTTAGAVLAVGHASNGQLAALRRRLEAVCPGAKSGQLVHLTLGQLVSSPSHAGLEDLKAYVRSFTADTIVLGQLRVDFLAYAEYRGPFLAMTIREICRECLRGSRSAELIE